MTRTVRDHAPRSMPHKERLRFFSKQEGDCWVWQASKNRSGYGRFYYQKKLHVAHRVSYELFVGPVPDGLELDHLCGNRSCVNPAHLEPVTHQENVSRGKAGEWLRAKANCPQGHPYAGSNLYVGRRGERRCRACMRVQNAASNETRKVRA